MRTKTLASDVMMSKRGSVAGGGSRWHDFVFVAYGLVSFIERKLVLADTLGWGIGLGRDDWWGAVEIKKN